ncbi:MAG: DUF4422 domain-containing protein [Eubacteriales bacterium]
MLSVKLYVSSHKEFPIPKHPLIQGIYLGNHVDLLPKDNTGENISHKNPYYCELTAQYWVWKNQVADYYGFFHYRRYLSPRTRNSLPYSIEKLPNEFCLNRMDFSKFQELVYDYDLIAPKGEEMHLSVEAHYASAPDHHKKHLDIAKKSLVEMWPEYENSMEVYFSQSKIYFGNMYIMSRAVFLDYCAWLFPVLEDLEAEIDFDSLSVAEQRVIGYVAERLFGVYYTHRKEDLRVLEVPRVDFEPNFRVRTGKKLVNFLLPPESKRRFWVKGCRKK